MSTGQETPPGRVIKPASLAPPNFGAMDLDQLRAFAALHSLDVDPNLDRVELERAIKRSGPSHWIATDGEQAALVKTAYETGLGVAADAMCEDCRNDQVHDLDKCPAAPIRALMEPE